MINLKVINEDNFLDAFQLILAKRQEKYVSNPVRSLAQAYVYRNNALVCDEEKVKAQLEAAYREAVLAEKEKSEWKS